MLRVLDLRIRFFVLFLRRNIQVNRQIVQLYIRKLVTSAISSRVVSIKSLARPFSNFYLKENEFSNDLKRQNEGVYTLPIYGKEQRVCLPTYTCRIRF